MTTTDATCYLASILNTCSDRSGHDDETHLYLAVQAGERWAWADAEYHLRLAYEALGAAPPDATGLDWHDGRHPIQVEAGL